MKPLLLLPTAELICPVHPKVKIEEYTIACEYPDTIEFCDCCTADCTPFCKNCNQWSDADFNEYVRSSDD